MNLAKSLNKFYKKTSTKFLFNNGMSLNQLAFEMWGRLGCKQIDTGVLFKILSGKRLFTPLQLEVFCSILNVSKEDKKYLHHCLYLDHCKRFGVNLGESFFLDSEFIFFDEVLDQAEDLLYKGRCDELEILIEVIEKQLKNIILTNPNSKEREKFLSRCLYLKGRVIGSITVPRKVIEKTLPITDALLEIGKTNVIRAYANTLLSNAYYVVGNYSNAIKSSYFYEQSINYAKKAIGFFPDDNKEKLFAIRTMVASSGYIKDKKIFGYAKKEADKAIRVTPKENFVNALHLYGTIAKTMALLGYKDPLKVKEIPKKYFNKTLKDTGIYEVSDIRNELELYSILKINDLKYLTKISKRGLELAKKYKYDRHIKNIKKLINSLLPKFSFE